jgi:lipopolysaccharide exporter
MLRWLRTELEQILRFLQSTEGSTSTRILRGTAWVFMMKVVLQVVNVVRLIILARLLVPADFGLMDLVALSTAILVVMSQTGIWTAIIQRDNVGCDTLDTAWLIQAGRGLLLATIIVVLANPVASFFDSPALIPVLRVMALTFMFSGLKSVGLILLEKEMAFRTLTYYSLVVAVASLLFAAAAAVLWRNVWALVAGELAGSLTALILSYVVHRYRPRLRFDRDQARELWTFGRYINAGGIVTYLCTQGDDAYVGKVLGTEALGFYGLAYRWSNLPATSISELVSRVSLPAYAAVKNDLPKLRRLYVNALRVTALLAFPATALLFALAPYLVAVLYGDRWLPLVPAFMVLCAYGLERAIGSVAGHVFVVMGNPKLAFQLNLIKLAVMAVTIVPLTAALGILGTSIAVTLSAVAVQAAVIPLTARYLQMPIRAILGPLARPALGAGLVVGLIMGLRSVGDWPLEIGSLVMLGGAGAMVYLASTLVGNGKSLQAARALVASQKAMADRD